MKTRYDLPDSEVLAARNGDKAAQSRVFASVERLCWWVANKYRRALPSTMTMEDAVQDCRIGVLDAIRKFDASKGSFGTYASVWMRARLEMSIEREKAGAASQDILGAYEHRAFAREFAEENPIKAAASLPVAIPAYTAAKAMGLTGARSGASLEEMKQGFIGLGEGLKRAFKKGR